MSSAPDSASHPVSEVAQILLPALVSREVSTVAQRTALGCEKQAARNERWLLSITGRLLADRGWSADARHADAETIVTQRGRAYDESTVRKAARILTDGGAVRMVEETLADQVRRSVGASSVTAYTDMYDQVYWTKKLAYAAPIGSRGNRLLAATYFGLTFIRTEHGPLLAYHLSWHKPASPLLDAVDSLHCQPSRHRWLTSHVELHVLDRGTQGDSVLRRFIEQGIPYLTLSNGSKNWRQFKHPTHHTATGVPIFVRPDARLADVEVSAAVRATAPRTVVFPARPDKGDASTRSIQYRTAASLTDLQIETLDKTYKSRWPNNENPIKALVEVGFSVNRDRTLDVTTGRGHDGEVARTQSTLENLDAELRSFGTRKDHEAEVARRKIKRKTKTAQKTARRLDRAAARVEKGARANRGGEMLCKLMSLLLFNALALLLAKSDIAAVRTMTPQRVRELVLARRALVTTSCGSLVLQIESLLRPTDRAHQTEVVRLFNDARLRIRGASIKLLLHDPTNKIAPLRIAA